MFQFKDTGQCQSYEYQSVSVFNFTKVKKKDVYTSYDS